MNLPAFHLLRRGALWGLGVFTLAASAPGQMGSTMMPSVMSSAYTQSVVAGHKVSFHATATGSPAVTYQWQVSTSNGTSWANMMDDVNDSGTATDTITIQSVASSMNGNMYRMVATNSAGTATSAVFTMKVYTGVMNGPDGLAFDAAGNCWVSDSTANVIQKVSSSGMVTLMAGMSGLQGMADGTGTAAGFRQPGGMAMDAAGNMYVADTGNSLIRKISPTGVVTTMAGSAAHQDYKDGTGTDAWFNMPMGLTVDSAGNIYVADAGNCVIRKITASGTVTTLAGSPGVKGSADGTGMMARFSQPGGIVMDAAGMLYVADTLNHTIRKVTTSGVVTTWVGLMGVSGTSDGTGPGALFNQPMGMTFDGAGNLCVADSGNSSIRMVTPSGVVSTLAGLSSVSGMMDGMGTAAWFSMPKDVKYDGASALYVADFGNAEIRKVSLQGSVSSLGLTASSAGGSTSTSGTTTTGGASTPAPVSSAGGGSGGGAPSLPFVLTLLAALGFRATSQRRIRLG